MLVFVFSNPRFICLININQTKYSVCDNASFLSVFLDLIKVFNSLVFVYRIIFCVTGNFVT